MAGTIVANTINTDTGLFSTQNAYQGIAKAWVRFTVSGTTPTIVKSFNISSVTYNATGYYSFAFSTAQSDANYTANGTSGINTGGNAFTNSFSFGINSGAYYTAPTTSGLLWSILTQAILLQILLFRM
jgi:hypothetical protein